MIFGTDVPGTVAVRSHMSTFPVYCLQYGGISVQQKHTAMVLWLFSPITSEEKTTLGRDYCSASHRRIADFLPCISEETGSTQQWVEFGRREQDWQSSG